MSQECKCHAGQRVEARSEHGARYCRACGHWILSPVKPDQRSEAEKAMELTNFIMRSRKRRES